MSKMTTSRNRRRVSVFRRLRDISWCHFRRIWGLSPSSSSSSFRGKFESNKARKKREKRDRHSLIAATLLPDFRVDAQEKKVNRSESDSNYGHKFFSAVLSGSQPASCEVFATANHCRVSCHLRDIHHQLCHCPDIAILQVHTRRYSANITVRPTKLHVNRTRNLG